MSYAVALESLDQVEAEWRALLRHSAVHTVFLNPTWLRVWWDEFHDGRDLLLTTVRSAGRLAAVAPLLQEGRRLLLAGDTEICDYMDITVSAGEEEAAVTALLRALVAQEWDEWALWGVPAYSPTLTTLPVVAEAMGLEVTVAVEDICPRVELPTAWDDYLAGLGKKDRHELRRKLRRLAGAEASVRLLDYRTPAEVEAQLDDFLRLHGASHHAKAEFMTERMARFFHRMAVALAEQGLVRLLRLDVGGANAAALLCFDCGDELLLYNSGYDPALSSLSVGILSKALSLQRAIEEGKRWFDFLRGSEPYKYDLGAKDLRVYRCLVRRR
ncbi:MAG: GNAT family N-acetyltransferase [Dehalococcoidia bacterium]